MRRTFLSKFSIKDLLDLQVNVNSVYLNWYTSQKFVYYTWTYALKYSNETFRRSGDPKDSWQQAVRSYYINWYFHFKWMTTRVLLAYVN